MNKKGFTLVEVIVSLALLSLIGVAVGISLNKIFKDQNVKNYDEYVEKIKSSALLYANNTVDIINKLNSNYSYTVVTIKELVDKGYINKNLTNPETKEKINQDDSVRIYYNEDYEMLIEYPYTEKDEIYLYTMNYSIKYKSDEQDLCYKGLDGPTLQLVKVNTNDAGNKYEVISLKSDNNETKKIMAYMEDGSPCNIDTSKIGTYKIRYEYTIDGTDVRTSSNKKIAERTITVKPSKPNIDKFYIKYQIENIEDPAFDVYKAKLNLQASDVEGLSLKYCLVATAPDKEPNVTSCNGTSTDVQGNKWINVNSNNINYNINIKDLFALAEKEKELKISVFVKNDFEEYNGKENQAINRKNTTTYLLSDILILNLMTNEAFTESTKFYKNINANGVMSNEISKRVVIDDLDKNTNFQQAIKSYFDQTMNPFTKSYYFDSWYYETSLTNKVNNTDIINKVVNVYAKWVKDTTPPTCKINAKNPLTVTVSDNSQKAIGNWTRLNENLSSGTHVYSITDYAGNMSTCSISIIETTDTIDPCGKTIQDWCSEYKYSTYSDCWSSVSDRGEDVWAGCQYNGSMYRVCQYSCGEKHTYSCSSGYKKINDSWCYK